MRCRTTRAWPTWCGDGGGVGHIPPAERISIYHRSQNGAAGSFLVTPLQLDDGRVLLVVRGFYPLHTTPGELPAAPEGRVEVLGRIRTTEGRDAAHPDVERLLETRIVDVERLGRQLPGPVVPVYVELVDSDPPQPVGYPDPVPLVAPGLGNHLSYMVQWFIFATCVLIGWVFAVRRSAQQQRQAPAAGSVGLGVAVLTRRSPCPNESSAHESPARR